MHTSKHLSIFYRCIFVIPLFFYQLNLYMTSSHHPIHNNERIIIMDALRGLAILGIFIANLGAGFSFYNEAAPNTGPYFHSLDKQFLFWEHVFIEGKFYSIFSFLFGWGFAIQIARSEVKGISPASFMKRRLGFMFLLGLAHLLLLWTGDIVAFYAMVGFVLLWIRNRSDRTLFITAITCLLLPAVLYFLKMKFPVLLAPAGVLYKTGEAIDKSISGVAGFDDFIKKLKTGNYLFQLKTLLPGVFYRLGDLLFQDRFFKVLGMFITGYLLGRNGRYKTILINKSLLLKVALIGLAVGLPANYVLATYMKKGGYYQMNMDGMIQTLAYTAGVSTLALAYISLFFLLALTKPGIQVIKILQPPGKMAFSNYIMHSLIGSIIFYGMGFGMVGEVGPFYYTLLAFIVFAAQIVLSTIWLRYFIYGPVEWLWRSATYKKWQPLLKNKNHTTA